MLLWWCFPKRAPFVLLSLQNVKRVTRKNSPVFKKLGKELKKINRWTIGFYPARPLIVFISNNTLARVFSNLFEQIKFFFHGAICETSFPKYTFWEILSSNDKKLRHDLNTASWLTSHEILSKSSNHARSKLPHLKNGNDYCFYFWYFAATRQFCYYYYYYPYY